MKNLWDIDPSSRAPCDTEPGYDNLRQEYDSWESFLAKMGDSDQRYNTVIRFDWEEPDPDNERYTHELTLIFLRPLDPSLLSVVVKVQPEDQTKVRAFLEPRFEYLKNLWLPLE